jgi:hypothetical protein
MPRIVELFDRVLGFLMEWHHLKNLGRDGGDVSPGCHNFFDVFGFANTSYD